MPRPVCVACAREMHPEKNGYTVHFRSGCQIWAADLWQCPSCGARIVSGYGSLPIATSNMRILLHSGAVDLEVE